MTYSLKTGAATKERDIANESDFINVPWQITDEAGEVVHEAAQAFPFGTSEEDIRVVLSQTLTTFTQKKEGEDASREAQAAHDGADQIIGSVSNINITT